MSYKVFELKSVPDWQVDDIRYLLQENGIQYYETPRGNFGFSMSAIWVNDQSSYREARVLIDRYQQKLKDESTSQGKEELSFNYNIYALIILILIVVLGSTFYAVIRY